MIEDEQPAGLTVASDGTIQIGKFTLTAKGLIADESVVFEEWQQLGELLQRFEASIQWLIGDWMAYGDRHWGQTYEAVAGRLDIRLGRFTVCTCGKGVDFSSD
jgi:hypothetical protein